MKKMFKTLSLVAAILFATSCSKDDNNEVAEPAAKTVTVTMTVGYNAQSLSKVAVTAPSGDGNAYNQSFVAGDVIEFSGDATGTVTLNDANITGNGAFATFDVTLTPAGDAPLTNGSSLLSITLTSAGYEVFDGVGQANNITECCKKYGIWQDKNFTYSVDDANKFTSTIELQQQNAFVVMPTELTAGVTVKVGENTLEVNKCYAVSADTKITISKGDDYNTKSHEIKMAEVYTVVVPTDAEWSSRME